MKKRITLEEIIELNPSFTNPIYLKTDNPSGVRVSSLLKEIKVLGVHNRHLIAENISGDVSAFPPVALDTLLSCYPSFKRNVEFWDKEDVEYLWHQDKDEAIHHLLEEENTIPLELKIYGYARKSISPEYEEGLLENIYETLNGEYSSPDGDCCDPNEKVIEAFNNFFKILTEEYEPWGCEVVCSEKINTKEWIKKNRPDWLKDTSILFSEGIR